MRHLRRLSSLRLGVALATVVMVALGTILWLRTSQLQNDSIQTGQARINSPYQPVAMAGTQRPTALFVGDDFTAGFGGVGMNAYPYIVCASIGLNCNVDAQPGTGLLDGVDGQAPGAYRLVDRLATDHKAYKADVVIVDAGRNDLDKPTDAYIAALRQYLEKVRQLWPAAALVVISPSYVSAQPEPAYTERMPMIAQVAESAGAILIDPVAEGWYAGTDPSTLLIPEGTYPNQAGHRLIAGKLADSLESHGIGQPRGDV
jgi:lysophospholipase L1-like esterase